VASALTITCWRRTQVGFSAPYYEAGQALLVPTSSHVKGLDDLDHQRGCATVGSTSIKRLIHENVGAIPVPVAQRTDCLVRLQEGAVDAITSDDAILFGFQAQDPYTKIVGPPFSRGRTGWGSTSPTSSSSASSTACSPACAPTAGGPPSTGAGSAA
jgi:polar amino acid transport system substrate-binding protein